MDPNTIRVPDATCVVSLFLIRENLIKKNQKIHPRVERYSRLLTARTAPSAKNDFLAGTKRQSEFGD